MQLLPFFTSGTAYFGDKYFSRFVLQKTPYTVQLHPYPRLDFMLYRPKPYWYSLEGQSAVMGGFVPQFRFPVCYDSHRYSEWRQSYFLNVKNPGRCQSPSRPSSAPPGLWSTPPSATASPGSTSALTPP